MYPKAFIEIDEQTHDYLGAVDGEIRHLEEPVRTVALVMLAQGVIDNGGLRYFFDNDWPDDVRYSEFADAYERIGVAKGAEAIRSAAKSFGIADPESDVEFRREFMEANYDHDEFCVSGWDNSLCGNRKVYDALVQWVSLNAQDSFTITAS